MSFLLNSYLFTSPSSTEPTWDLGIQTTSSNETFGITLNGTNPNITVDWGDGTVETFTTTGSKNRTYASAGNYTVKIRGSFGENGGIRCGTSSAERQRLKTTSVIPTINGLTSFANCFNGCITFTTVPDNLFANNTAATNFSNCFSNCFSLITVPANLFANNTNATQFGSCFSGCTFTTVPDNLFANNTAATNFSNCFLSVTLTTASYSNLLINMASNAVSRQSNVSFGGGFSKYNTNGQTARNTLINTCNWSFADGNLEV